MARSWPGLGPAPPAGGAPTLFKSLRSRLILVGLVALLPLLVFFLQTQVQLQGVLEEGLAREAVLAAEAAADHHRVLLEETETILGLLAESGIPHDPRLCRDRLAPVLERSGYLGVLAVAEPDGDLRCVTPEAQEGVNVADRDYFQAAMETDRPAAGYHVGRVTGDPSLAMAYPIEGPEGQPLFLIGGVNLQAVEFLPASADVDPGRSVTLFEDDGRVLHGMPAGALGPAVPEGLVPDDPTDRSTRMVEASAPDGARRVYAVAPLVQQGGVADAHVAVGYDPELADALGRDVLLTNVLGLLLALGLLGAGIWAVMEFAFLRRLEPVLQTSRELAGGDLGARTGVGEGPDEVSQLAATIDQMAEGLQELRRREASEARRELEESERRFRQLAENIREIFWLYDVAEGRTIYVSPAFEAIAGRSPESIYRGTRAWLDTIHPDDREAAREYLETGLRREQEAEYRIVRPDGEVRWLRDSSSPVHDEQGRIIRIAGVAQDVTEQKELEEALRRASKLEAVGRLAGGIAHDFNNILTAIGANTQLLMADAGEGDPFRRELEEIDRGVVRAASLTRQLLQFSRQQPLRFRIVDPGRLVRDLLPMLARLLGPTIDLETEVDETVGAVRIDPNGLENVIVNLAVNARDAMPEGGTLTLGVRRTEVTGNARMERGPYVVITVRDTGSGIPAEDLPRIFEPFWTTKGPSKGTGLGLASAYGVVQQSGGHIRAESEIGRGATFTVYLPEVDEEEDEEEEIPSEELPATSAARSEGGEPMDRDGAGRTILVIEDEESVLSVTRRSLERFGYRVIPAMNGEEGVARLEEDPDAVDLVLSDVVMPGMDGRTVRAEVRRIRPDLPVILMSGYPADGEGRLAAIAEEGVPFIGKPFTPAELAERVAETLAGPEATRAPEG